MLIVIEGSDGSGKETQTKKLYERLISEGKICKKISFPNYESEASAPVKMYLAGRFGKDAEKINPYPISTMYAIDRYASFKEDWEKDFNLIEIVSSFLFRKIFADIFRPILNPNSSPQCAKKEIYCFP